MTSRCRRSDAATGVNDRYLHFVAIVLAVAAGGLTLALGVVGKGRRRGRQDRGKVTQCTGAVCKVAIHEGDCQVFGSFPSQGQSCLEKQSDDASWAIQAHLRDALASQADRYVLQGGDGLDTHDSDTEANTDVASSMFLESLTAARGMATELQESGTLELRTDVHSSCGRVQLGFEPVANAATMGELVYDAFYNVSGASTLKQQSSVKSWASAEGVSLEGIVHSYDDEIVDPNDSREGLPKPNDSLDALCDGGDLQPNDGFLIRTDPEPPDVQKLLTPTTEALGHDGTQMQVEASSIFDGLQEGLMPRGALTLHSSQPVELRRHRSSDDGDDDCEYPPGRNLDLDPSSRIEVVLRDTIDAGSSNCRRLDKSNKGHRSCPGTEDMSAGSSSCLNGFRSSLEVNGNVDLLVTIAIGNPLFAKDAPNTRRTPTASRGPTASHVGWCPASPAPRDVGPAADSASSGNMVTVSAFPNGRDGSSGRARRHLAFTPMFLAIDNPCFVGPATAAVFNPCFSSAEWGGAVPAVRIDLPVYTPASAAGRSEVGGSGDGFAATATAGGGGGRGRGSESVRWQPCNPLAAAAMAAAAAAGGEGVQGGRAEAVADALPFRQRQPEAASPVPAMTAAVHRDVGKLHQGSMVAPLWGQCPNTPCWSCDVKEQEQENQGKEHDEQQERPRLGHRTGSNDGAAAAEGKWEGEQAEVVIEEAVEIEVVKVQNTKAANPLNGSDLATPMTPAKQPPPLAAPLPGSPTSPTSPWLSSAAQVTPRPASEITDPVTMAAAATTAAAAATAVNVTSVSSTAGAAAAAVAPAPIGIDACGQRRHLTCPNPSLCLVQPPVPTPVRTCSRPPHPSSRPATRPLSSSPAPHSKRRQQQQHQGRHHVDYQQQQQPVCGSPGMSARSASTTTDRSIFRGPSSAATTAGASTSHRRSPWRPTATTGSKAGTGSAAKSSWPAASADNRDMNPVVGALTVTTAAAASFFKGSDRCGGMQGLLATPVAAAGGPPTRAATRPPFRPPSKHGGGFQPGAHGGSTDTTTIAAARTAAAPGLTHGLVDRQLPDGVSNLPSYMRPTQASLAAGSWGGGGGGASKSVAAPHGGGGGMATIRERKPQDRQDPKRPRWR
ncbi:hypothetical protein VaNZ11_002032 [Volvox africanus]|uniref:Uncharacterized protein n=1 Tax=Volvox africanus TaxID=51714 RepID=A0ABQ5RRU9_9CHLO|nr:hypothetical protein VaNZ11_002032 [Volvox africanus]